MPSKFDNPATWTADYAPGLSISNGYAYWKCPKRYLQAGYPQKSIKLSDNHAQECRQHTRDLLRWWASRAESAADNGTWSYLIRRYRSDQFSPYQDIKPITRGSYDPQLDKWDTIIGKIKIGDLTYERARMIERAMQNKGRTASNIRRMFTMLRTVATYGRQIRMKDAAEVRGVLSDMRFRAPPQRQVSPTRGEVERIILKASERGAVSLALGYMLQFELCLRVFDVFGQWEQTEIQSGIVKTVHKRDGTQHLERWTDGLTWDMLSPDCTTLTKVISKTQETLQEPYTWDLRPIPTLVDQLRSLRPSEAVGPVLVSGSGLPFELRYLSREFGKFRDAAGVRKEITLRDLRAGGITEAKALGIDPFTTRDAAQHTQVSTTDRYSRARSDAANKVVALRHGGK